MKLALQPESWSTSKTINQLYLDQSLNWTFCLFCQFNQLRFSLDNAVLKVAYDFSSCYPIAFALQTGSPLSCQMACCVVLFLSTDLLLNSFSAKRLALPSGLLPKGLLCQKACCPTANSFASLRYRTPFCIVSYTRDIPDVTSIEYASGLTVFPGNFNCHPLDQNRPSLPPVAKHDAIQ